MDGFPETQGKILNNSSNFFENSSKILSKLKQNPQKLNLPEIPFTCVAAKTAKKQAWVSEKAQGLGTPCTEGFSSDGGEEVVVHQVGIFCEF